MKWTELSTITDFKIQLKEFRNPSYLNVGGYIYLSCLFYYLSLMQDGSKLINVSFLFNNGIYRK